jgi:hypothetical protein
VNSVVTLRDKSSLSSLFLADKSSVNFLYGSLLGFLQEPRKCFRILNLEPGSNHSLRGRFGSKPAIAISVMMNKTESDRIHELCSLIAVEQDRRKFLELVGELNRILDKNDHRLKETQSGK